MQGEVLIAKIFCRMYWSQFPQLPIPLSICSVHQPAINRTVSSIPKSLTQMTATVKVIRDSEELQSPDKVVPKCFCGLLGRGTDFFLSFCMFVSEGTCCSGAGGASRTFSFSLPLVRDCGIPATRKQTLGKCPFSFPPSHSPSPPSISLCPGQRDYGIRMEEHLIVSQKVRFNCRTESSFPVFLPYVGLLTNPPPEHHHIPLLSLALTTSFFYIHSLSHSALNSHMA